MTGAPVGEAPGAANETWNEGPEAGGVAHWKAHPMFQPGLVTVKAGLVQFPCIWVGPSSSLAPEAVAVVVVEVPLVEVDVFELDPLDFVFPAVVEVDVDCEVDPPVEEIVLVVEAPPVDSDVVVPDPADGNLYAPEPEPEPEPELELAPTVW
jgi:hypothetical protein